MIDGNIMVSLVPTLIVLVSAVVLRRSLEALVLGVLAGHIILSKQDFVATFLSGVTTAMGDETLRWISLVVALFGILIALLRKSGATESFAACGLRYVKSRTQMLLATWFMGLLIFIDDYLNALVVGPTMQKLADWFRVSREMLAYIVDTTAAPVCILVPISTWAVFVAGLIESNGLAVQGGGIEAYIRSLPFMFYAWIGLLMPPLIVLLKVKPIGSMKQVEERAQMMSADPLLDMTNEVPRSGLGALNFVLPIALLIFLSWLFDADILKSAFVTLLLVMVFYCAQRLMTLNEMLDTSLVGIKSMLEVIAILIMSFALKDINDQLQLTEYVIDIAQLYFTPQLLPVGVFITLAVIAFSTGTFWGLYAIAFPIVLPLAVKMGVNPFLMVGAIVSAGAFGSHSCFYSDSTVLSAKGSGCSSMSHALTQLPYALIAGLASAFCFLMAGIVD